MEEKKLEQNEIETMENSEVAAAEEISDVAANQTEETPEAVTEDAAQTPAENPEAEQPEEAPKPKKNPKEMDGQMDLFSMMGM